jgi:hypothetical protein
VAVLTALTLLTAACGSSSSGDTAASAPGDTVAQVTLPRSIPAGVTLRVGDQLAPIETDLSKRTELREVVRHADGGGGEGVVRGNG